MPKLIITTVGTSLISNPKPICSNESFIGALKAGLEPKNYNSEVITTAEKLKTAVEGKLKGKCLSAEMNSLITFKDSREHGFKREDTIAFLATDTIEGKFCADVHKKVLDDLQWCSVLGPYKIEGLNTKSAKKFMDAGLNNLKKTIDNILKENSWQEKYFNITGGYKGIIPFATLHAFDNDMKLIYLYEEDGSELMIIEKEPETQTIVAEVITLSAGGPD